MLKKIVTIDRFINKEALSGILLFLATIAAVVVANSALGKDYYNFWHLPLGINFGEHKISMTLTYWINDALMALFFLMVGLEIKREMSIGELSSVSKAAFPIVAALGGMLVPALIYLALNPNNPLGFGVPMATDIAFALGILMLLGTRINPALKLFLVALAVVDDLGAIFVVATVYTDEINFIYFIHVLVIYAIIWILNFRGVTKITPYLILGIFLWIYIHAIGIHATIAGVLLGFAIPIKSKINEKKFIDQTRQDINEFEEHIDEIPILNHHQIDNLENIAYSYDKVQNPLVRLEHNLHSLSAFFIMPLFAFSNAGVIIDFSTISPNIMIVLGVILGLMVGKPLGILGFTYLGCRLKIVKKPNNISWSEILAIGFIAGIGFTMSIFISHLAFLDETIISAVKFAVFVASIVAALIGTILLLKKNKTIFN